MSDKKVIVLVLLVCLMGGLIASWFLDQFIDGQAAKGLRVSFARAGGVRVEHGYPVKGKFAQAEYFARESMQLLQGKSYKQFVKFWFRNGDIENDVVAIFSQLEDQYGYIKKIMLLPKRTQVEFHDNTPFYKVYFQLKLESVPDQIFVIEIEIVEDLTSSHLYIIGVEIRLFGEEIKGAILSYFLNSLEAKTD